MKSVYIFLFIVLGFQITQAQEIRSVVKDSASGFALPYVNITLLNTDRGTTTNENGEFVFDLSKVENDSIFISYVGYTSKLFPVKEAKKEFPKVIYLQEHVDEMDEVLVSVKKKKYTGRKKVGFKRKGKYKIANRYGYETCTWIKNKELRKGKLLKLLLYFKRNNDKEFEIYPAHFLVKFYAYDAKTAGPGKLLSYEPLLIKPSNKTGTTKINLENLNIDFPEEGIFVGLESIKPEGVSLESDLFTTSPYRAYIHKKEPLTWSSYRGKKWKKERIPSKIKRTLYLNPFIKMVVKYEK